MARKSLADDVCTSIMLPGEMHRAVKAACALEGVSIREKLTELLAREYPQALEPAKRKRRQPSKIAHPAEAGAERAV